MSSLITWTSRGRQLLSCSCSPPFCVWPSLGWYPGSSLQKTLWQKLDLKQLTAKNQYQNSKQISQKRNCAAPTVLLSTFICLWAIYTFPRLICLFCCRKYVNRSWEYLNRLQTHECGNWDWGRAIPRKGIQTLDFRCSAAPWYVWTLSNIFQ